MDTPEEEEDTGRPKFRRAGPGAAGMQSMQKFFRRDIGNGNALNGGDDDDIFATARITIMREHSHSRTWLFFLFYHTRIPYLDYGSVDFMVAARYKLPFALRPGLSQEDPMRTKETTKENALTALIPPLPMP